MESSEREASKKEEVEKETESDGEEKIPQVKEKPNEELEHLVLAHQNEIEKLVTLLKTKEEVISDMMTKIADLEAKMYEPRVKRLQNVEKEFKERMEEYLISESTMESMFICSHCLRFLKNPITLVPCGHSFCKECVDEMKKENYGRLVCQDCPDTIITSCFESGELETLIDRFFKRKTMTAGMHQWLEKLSAKKK